MEIVYTPQRSDNKLYYDIKEPLISVYLNDALQLVYDITNPVENAFIYQTETEVVLLRYYGEDEKHLFET